MPRRDASRIFRFIASFDVGICQATVGDMAILTAIKVIVSSAL